MKLCNLPTLYSIFPWQNTYLIQSNSISSVCSMNYRNLPISALVSARIKVFTIILSLRIFLTHMEKASIIWIYLWYWLVICMKLLLILVWLHTPVEIGGGSLVKAILDNIVRLYPKMTHKRKVDLEQLENCQVFFVVLTLWVWSCGALQIISQ